MMEMIKMVLRNQKGQGMVEYGLILALVAVAAVTVMGTMGTSITSTFQSVVDKL